MKFACLVFRYVVLQVLIDGLENLWGELVFVHPVDLIICLDDSRLYFLGHDFYLAFGRVVDFKDISQERAVVEAPNEGT